ncbi:RAMP superfamily CRISPR-associated protein [Nocardiopsis coralliicola]
MGQRPEWTEFGVEAVTPLLAHQEDGHLAVATIRGQVRHWMRALVGPVPCAPGGPVLGADLHALAAVERHVFGSTRQASPVRMRTAADGRPKIAPAGSAVTAMFGSPGRNAKDNSKFATYLLGQGHATPKNGNQLLKPAVQPGSRYTLKLMLPTGPGGEDLARLFLASLWLACSYGGFGARVRRGFGGIALTHKCGPLPSGWNAASFAPPDYAGLAHLPATGGPLDDAAAVLPRVIERAVAEWHAAEKEAGRTPRPFPDPAFAGQAAEFPVLGPDTTLAALDGTGPAPLADAVGALGERYRRFRATEDHPGAGYTPAVKTPEHVPVIAQDVQRDFPLGALGLPVIFNSKEGGGRGQVNAMQHRENLRRASPLWFRFVREPGGRSVRLFSLGFTSPFLPDGVDVVRTKGGSTKPLQVTDAHVRSALEAWMRGDESWERPR